MTDVEKLEMEKRRIDDHWANATTLWGKSEYLNQWRAQMQADLDAQIKSLLRLNG